MSNFNLKYKKKYIKYKIKYLQLKEYNGGEFTLNPFSKKNPDEKFIPTNTEERIMIFENNYIGNNKSLANTDRFQLLFEAIDELLLQQNKITISTFTDFPLQPKIDKITGTNIYYSSFHFIHEDSYNSMFIRPYVNVNLPVIVNFNYWVIVGNKQNIYNDYKKTPYTLDSYTNLNNTTLNNLNVFDFTNIKNAQSISDKIALQSDITELTNNAVTTIMNRFDELNNKNNEQSTNIINCKYNNNIILYAIYVKPIIYSKDGKTVEYEVMQIMRYEKKISEVVS